MKVMKKGMFILFLFLLSLNFISADCDSKLNPLKKGEDINYKFRCFDENNNYCNSATVLVLNIEYPNGTNAIDNSSMTYNLTYFNHTLPTSQIGCYSVIITSPSSNNTLTTFSYEVTPTGDYFSVIYLIADIVLIFLIIILLVFAQNKYSKTDFDKKREKIIESHNGNFAKTFIKNLGYGLMKNSFLWYYTFGWILFFVINDLVYRFNSDEIYSYLQLFFDIYSLGFLLVIIVFISILIDHFKTIKDIIDDINKGVVR